MISTSFNENAQLSVQSCPLRATNSGNLGFTGLVVAGADRVNAGRKAVEAKGGQALKFLKGIESYQIKLVVYVNDLTCARTPIGLRCHEVGGMDMELKNNPL